MPDVAEAAARRCSRCATCRPGTARATSCTASIFDVGTGEVVTLLGRNGAGKTTTLRSIMGMLGKRDAARSASTASETIGLPLARRSPASASAICPEERGIFSSLSVEENLMLPPVVQPGGLTRRADLRAVPQPQGAAAEPGHQALGRRAADAGDRPHPAHRRASCCCSTSRPRASPRSSSSRSARPSAQLKQRRLHHRAGRAELPLRRDRRRPALRRRAGPRDRHDPQRRARRQYRQAARLSRRLSPTTKTNDKRVNQRHEDSDLREHMTFERSLTTTALRHCGGLRSQDMPSRSACSTTGPASMPTCRAKAR